MADEALRNAARRAADGDAQDRTRLLAERLRSGKITQDRVDLAAYCGLEEAAELVDSFDGKCWVRQGRDTSGDLRKWSSDLSNWGLEPLILATVHIVRLSHRVWVDSVADERWLDRDRDVIEAGLRIAAAMDYLNCPCPKHLECVSARAAGRMEPHYEWSTWAVCRAMVSIPEAAKKLAIQAIAECTLSTNNMQPVIDEVRSIVGEWALRE